MTLQEMPIPDHLRVEDRSGRARVLTWLPVIALMVLVFEVTSDPALGVAVGCCKFGARDFGTALWLRRVDPIRVRGRACGWFCVTRGTLKVGLAALLCMLLASAVEAAVGVGGPNIAPLMHQVIAAFLVLFACHACAALTAWLGVTAALIGRLKVWADFDVNLARKANFWPPILSIRRGTFQSFARLVVLIAVISACALVFGVFLVLGYLSTCGHLNQMLLKVDASWILAVVLGGAVVLVVISVFLARRLGRRIIAAWPHECYTDAFSWDPRSSESEGQGPAPEPDRDQEF